MDESNDSEQGSSHDAVAAQEIDDRQQDDAIADDSVVPVDTASIDKTDLAEPNTDLAEPNFERPSFAGPARGIRRSDDQGRLVLDGIAGRNSILGFTPELVGDAIGHALATADGSGFAATEQSDCDRPYESLNHRLSQRIESMLIGTALESINRVTATASVEEAIEVAVMVARRDDRFRILTLDTSDHGRSVAGRSAGAQFSVRENIGPLLAGFTHVDTNADDPAAAISAAVDEKTSAILLPLFAGAGDGRSISHELFKAAESVAAERSLALILDHTQVPVGGDGRLLAIDDIHFDSVLLSAGLMGGLPGGLVLSGDSFPIDAGLPMRPAQTLVALETLQRADDRDLFANAAEAIRSTAVEIAEALAETDILSDITTLSSRIALSLNVDANEFAQLCRRHGLLMEVFADDTAVLTLPIHLTADDRSDLVRTLTEVTSSLALPPT